MSDAAPAHMSDEAAELTALQHENALLRATLDAIDGTIVVYDAERRYVLGNRAYHEHFPHLPDDAELTGKRYEEVLALSIAEGTVLDPEAYIDTAKFIARRSRQIDEDGTTPREVYDPVRRKWYMIQVSYTPSGARVALRVDIDGQKRLQRELEQASKAAETASHAKSMFLANIGHELRTPLNAVINFAQLIQDQIHGELGSPLYSEYAQSIRESGAHLLALIEELLDLAQAREGRLTLKERPVNLRTIVLSVCRLLEPEAAATGVRLATEIPADLPSVRADGTRLRQVLFNLLTNAIKFSEQGGIVRVSVSRTVEGHLQIEVTDTGPGIEMEDMARIMLPFERATDRMGREIPGVGLGLPLANHLISLHGGKLEVDSTPGAGTTASFSLPADRIITPVTTSV
jgi:signal transduction histidine kinase